VLSWLCVHCNRGRLRSVVRHCLVSHQCRCVLQRLVWLTLCILAYRLFATTCKHPCLKPLGTHAKASLPLYERSVGFASCKAFGRSFQASLPCLLLPLHRTSLFPQPLQKDNNPSPRTQPSQNRTIPRKSPTPLPPLSKVRCCRPKKFGRLPEGLSHHPLPLHQPFQIRTIPRKSPTPLPPLSKGGGLTARHKLLLCCV